MSKTIWFINEYAGSPYHGMVFRHYFLAKYLQELGVKVFIITGNYSHLFFNQPNVKRSFEFEEIDGIKYLWVRVPFYRNAHDKRRVFKWLYFAAKVSFFLPVDKLDPPDVVIASSPSLFSFIPAYVWARRFGAKLFFEVRDIWPLTLVDVGGISKNHPFVKMLETVERFAYKVADKVISVLPFMDEHIASLGIFAGKFIHIPNGIAVEDFSGKKLPQDIERLFPNSGFTVGYVGTVGEANALDAFVEAAVEVAKRIKCYFLIVGKGKKKEKLERKAQKLEISNVIFIPPVPKKLVISVLQEIDTCFISLKNRSLFRFGVSPNKVFDYMLASKPILWAVDSGNNPVEEGKCGLKVKPEDPKSIADGVLKLFRAGPKEMRKMGFNGKKYVLKKHNYEILAIKLFNVITANQRNPF